LVRVSAVRTTALILFTPERAAIEQISFQPDVGVPDIAFRLADLTDRFPPDVTHTVQRIASATQYGSETILLLERNPGLRPRTEFQALVKRTHAERHAQGFT
jgi:hypothetical protein